MTVFPFVPGPKALACGCVPGLKGDERRTFVTRWHF
jgi:hypothetical protein